MTEDMLLCSGDVNRRIFSLRFLTVPKIKIPAVSAFVISIISSAVLYGFNADISAAAERLFPESFCRTAGAVLLGVIGITGFCQNGLKSILKKT